MEEGFIFIEKAKWLYDDDIFNIKQYIEMYESEQTHFRDKLYALKQINRFSYYETPSLLAELYDNELLYLSDNIPDKSYFTGNNNWYIFMDEKYNDVTEEIIQRFGDVIWKS